MKTIALKLAILFLLFANQAFARILTVANQTTPQVAQYNSIQAAHDAAQSGDTIYVYPTLSAYKGAKLSKKLNVIGNGFTKVNDFSDCSKVISSDTLFFNAGSEGSVISSLSGYFKVNVNTNNILIQKCKIIKINIGDNTQSVLIINCIIKNSNRQTAIRIGENSFAYITNNVISVPNASYYDDINNSSIYVGLNSNCILKNNIIETYNVVWSSTAKDILLYDNIFISECPGCGDHWEGLSPYAVIKNAPWIGVSDSNWCVDYQNNNFHLKSTSPGKNAGTDGKDLGIYGGDYPFIDDGAPALPTVYYMKISPTASQKDGLSVEIKAKTN